MTEFRLSKLENPESDNNLSIMELLTKHKVETKIAFCKCNNVARNHAVLLSHGKCFELLALKSLLVNNKELKF